MKGLSVCALSVFFSINKVGVIFLKKILMFHYFQVMVKEEWKMKVDQSVGFSTLILLPKVNIMTVY